MNGRSLRVTATLLLLSVTAVHAAAIESRPPVLDKTGRMWVYQNGKAGLIFIPYGVMPEEMGKNVSLDLECREKPHLETAGATLGKDDSCLKIGMKWTAPFWAGVAFISGPTDEKSQWWGEDDRGTHFNLGQLPKKKLVFYARGETGKERIQAKVGILGDKPFGDSLKIPLESKWLKLSTEWTRYEMDLSKVKPEALHHICNGFTFVLAQGQQDDPGVSSTQFYLDTIYFE